MLPGAGATIATFLSYGIEKKAAKNPEEFGKGAIEGVAGPEAANNASAGGSLVLFFESHAASVIVARRASTVERMFAG